MTTREHPLLAYARRRLQLAAPHAEPAEIDTVLNSQDFKALHKRFDLDLERLRRRHAGTPVPRFNRSTQEATPYPMKNLGPATLPTPAPAPPAPTFRLPNARAGDPYQQPLEVSGGQAVVYDAAVFPADLALAFDAASGTVRGTPAQPGEYIITIDYRDAVEPAGRQAQVPLVVTPNPRSMWRELPSDQADPYWRPDQRSDRIDGSALHVLAASKRGRSHAHVGSFRDDDYAIAALPDTGWTIAIVADGAGSARYARKGAAIICEQARDTLLAILAGERSAAIDQAAHTYHQARALPTPDPQALDAAWQTLRNALYGAVGNAAYYAAKGIMDEAAHHQQQQADTSFKDYASTALITICKRYPFGTLCAAYWVGDGAVGIYRASHGVTLLGDVDSGEYSGQTRFLESAEVTQQALLRRTRFDLVDDLTALVVMTDGVSDARFDTEARLARADDWHVLWQDLQAAVGLDDPGANQPQRLLDWLDFWSQGNHDDRTIALIYPGVR